MTTPINYHLNFARFNEHLVDVTLTFTAENDSPSVWLPSWLAGSYLIREFARHITAVHYTVNEQTHRANKLNKGEWQLTHAKKGDTLSVTYEVYCYDLSVRTAYVDNQRIFGNFSSLALAVSGQEHQPITATLDVPKDFYKDKGTNKVIDACGLPTSYEQTDRHVIHCSAPNYDELIDYPFEIAEQSIFEFTVTDNKNTPLNHRFFISGHVPPYQFDKNRLKKDVQQICQTYVNWLGDTPFEHYTFMTFASGNDYGGLEHINSTALVTPRDDLPSISEGDEPSDNYQRFLGLCSHEYFHAWWVKTVRPDVMINVDLRKEAYTPLLWVFEGFTSYIDDFMLQASGVASKESYLKLLTAQINRYQQTAGRALQSVAESSFDAWIKLYRADENTGNAGISYYNKGALVALCLDLLLLAESEGKYRLFDVVKAFYQRAKDNAKQGKPKRIGMTNDNLTEVISEFISAEVWQDFYQRYVIGLDSLPIDELLSKNGIEISHCQPLQADNQQAWGMVVSDNAQGLMINKINRNSVASKAGLSAKDVIVAIDGIKASKKQLSKVANGQLLHKQSVRCYAFRRDELMQFDVPASTDNGQLACASLNKMTLKITDKEMADKWLNCL
ncbi:MAG: M61 family metallopeptidase [Moraxellaceae bacterium]|nr:M61 family metallopeptidase [Moraxellaceae bacterium]